MELKWYNKQGKIYTDIQQNSMRYLFAEERELQINIKIGTVVRSYVHTGAITMLPDEEGFFYPVIDGGICIKCHSCEKVCPVSRRKKDE